MPKSSRAWTSHAVIQDLHALMTTSQPWWPADYRSLRAIVHPDGVAQCGHVPYRRWSRWRGHVACSVSLR